jgi:hypothetical protein
MDADHPVVHLAATTEPLTSGPDRLIAALGRSRFIDTADRLGVSVLTGDQPLALVADAAFIPLDRFQETL